MRKRSLEHIDERDPTARQTRSTSPRPAVTIAYIVPPIAVFLAKHPMARQADLSSVHTFFSGAAPLDATIIENLQETYGARATQGYGLTETSPVICMNPTKPGAAGKLLPNMEGMVMDPESGEGPLPLGSWGELYVRGPNVMLGYLGREDATAQVLRADGFLRTGDMAKFDEEGNIWIGDRLKEFIKVKGFQGESVAVKALPTPVCMDKGKV